MTALFRKRFSELCDQLDVVEATKHSEPSAYSNAPTTQIDRNLLLNWKVKAKSLLQSTCGSDSLHVKQFEENESGRLLTSYQILGKLRAVFLAAREDFEGGYLPADERHVLAAVV